VLSDRESLNGASGETDKRGEESDAVIDGPDT
jgi:hypothetical protein